MIDLGRPQRTRPEPSKRVVLLLSAGLKGAILILLPRLLLRFLSMAERLGIAPRHRRIFVAGIGLLAGFLLFLIVRDLRALRRGGPRPSRPQR